MAIGVQLERDQLNNWTINGPGRLANSISASILISFVLFVSFAAILQPFIGGLSPFPCYFFFFDAPPFYRHSLQLIRHSSQLSRAILFASVLGFLAILSAFLTDSHNLQPSSRVFHAFRLIICGHFAAILRRFWKATTIQAKVCHWKSTRLDWKSYDFFFLFAFTMLCGSCKRSIPIAASNLSHWKLTSWKVSWEKKIK